MICNELKALKDSKGITNRELAERTGIPESTIARIISGQTDSPSFQNVADIVIALGGSLDEITGIQKDEPPQLSGIRAQLADMLINLRRIDVYVAEKNKWLTRMFWYCSALTFLMIILLTVTR